jgi:hypothetical protein
MKKVTIWFNPDSNYWMVSPTWGDDWLRTFNTWGQVIDFLQTL